LISLTERERTGLDLIRRHRAATAEILTAQVCSGSESAMKKMISRLRDYVASDPLGAKSVYYRLTPAGAKLLGAPEEIARPLGPQALPKALGVLDFCCGGSIPRQRYVRQEFAEDFPELTNDLLGKDYHTDFFLDFEGEQARFGQIVVDLGGDYKKLLSKCRVRLREYLDLKSIRDLVSDGLFTFAIVVAEDEKAEAIRLAIKEKPLRARVLVETSAELRKCPLQLGGLE
jgi:hypothetical protein